MKIIFFIIIFIIVFLLQSYVEGLQLDECIYNAIVKHHKPTQILIKLAISAVFAIFPSILSRFIKSIRCKCRTDRWKLTHVKNNASFVSKLENNLFKKKNKYLVKCFDVLHEIIMNPINDEQKFLVLGGYAAVTINNSLIDAIDNIASNGVNFSEKIYLIFLKTTASMRPKKVFGIWDLTIKPNIPEIGNLKGLEKEIMNEYRRMYNYLSNSKERIFLYDEEQKTLTDKKIGDDKIEKLVMYMNNQWGIKKFYFIPKAQANGLLDGLILDGQFYLSYSKNENGDGGRVYFSTFSSALKDTIEELKAKHINKLEGYPSFDVFH